MITTETPLRLSALGNTIVRASEELCELYDELSKTADSQLSEAAQAFLAEHSNPNRASDRRLYHEYGVAHENLLKAATVASSVRDLWQRSNTFKSKCAWWWSGGKGCGMSEYSPVKIVCERAHGVEIERTNTKEC